MGNWYSAYDNLTYNAIFKNALEHVQQPRGRKQRSTHLRVKSK
jgi:hypothetical protein